MQGYLYDPHTHTAETSKCGHLPAADVVERYVMNLMFELEEDAGLRLKPLAF